MTRRLVPSALFAVLMAVFLMVRLGATAATPAGRPRRRRLPRQRHRPVGQPARVERRARPPERRAGDRDEARGEQGGALHIGTPVFVGAHHVNGRLVARVVENLGGLQIAPTASQKLMTLLKGAHPQQSSGDVGAITSGNCILDFGFDPRSRC